MNIKKIYLKYKANIGKKMVYEKYWFLTTLDWNLFDLKKDDDRKTNYIILYIYNGSKQKKNGLLKIK